MTLPLIHIKVREVQKHGANVLLVQGSHYADIDDIAEAMHVPDEIIYGALWALQDGRIHCTNAVVPK